MIQKVSANIELDDLVQVGMIALHESMNRYVDDGRATFSTYASRRIHGAMIDELRRSDPLTRQHRKEDPDLHTVSSDDVELEDLVCSIDTPLEHLEKFRKYEALDRAIKALPERKQLILQMYYEDEMRLRQIGDLFGITESAVSYELARISKTLHAQLREY
jgi:RNA polymerase sigma factor for flagellar operon FliA